MASYRLFVQHEILEDKQFFDESLFKIFVIISNNIKAYQVVEPLTLLIFLPSQLMISSNFIHMVVSYILISSEIITWMVG